ncbi:hypothetical protein MEQU1_002366 [Malassezia equina]|uniref:Glycolipid transfer protein domain-containing protein n=1 Tax=Malassezia equina TaxID=1381935 RepID=A0AAF0EKB7_9BASI|nr:hypothetical protein MEQU1_002366 [Malassezia equina]
MSTYFDTLRTGIATSEFIEATEGVVKLFDLLGSTAFAVVQNDMNGNIKHLVKNEGQPGDKKRTATEGLLWLLRGLDFTAQALRRSIENPSEELSVSFTNAYEKTLRKYHSMMVRPIFTACPYRKDFYAKLGPSEESVRAPLLEWLAALENIVATMQKFYEYLSLS